MLPSISALADEGELKFTNFAKVIGKQHGKTFYSWRVFVDEPDEVLERIDEVQYLLHPTFPDPLQVRTNPRPQVRRRSFRLGAIPDRDHRQVQEPVDGDDELLARLLQGVAMRAGHAT